ncbi:Alpha/Beta hydrolase protein [Chytriomyces sp. MP71]|nr:Alpha/Beta hydrolase protein [Chytriomyces sp. MP71]
MTPNPEQLVFIPSSDGVSLEARIRIPVASSIARKDICLIISHPYGRLGGNLQNNVVDAISLGFAKEFMTVRFNFRGVGQSTGRGSFTGSGEVDDVLSVAKYVKERVDLRPKYFLLCGYSYGSIPVCTVSSELDGCIGEISVCFHIHLMKASGVISISFPASVMWLLTMGNSSKYIHALRSCPLTTPKLFITGA